MKGFNLTELAIRHKALSIYFMIVCLVAGVSAYLHLGRNEDPEFTVKTMVVVTLWPGATQEETMQQVTDRIEKKLQDTPNLYYLKSYTVAGTSTVFVYLLESTPKKDVPDLWYQVRKKVGDIRQTLPQGIVGPFFNDEFGDTYGIIYGFTAEGFSHRELRDYAEEARSRLLRVKDVSKAEFLGTQDERIYVEFSTHRLAELGMDRMELVQALVTQNAVVPSGVIQTKNEAVLMDVTGRFESEKDLQQVNFSFGGKMLRLGDIATITRGYADPPQPKFRVNGKDAIGVALSMRTGGDILALEKNLDHVMEELKADLPVGIETFLVSNQPKVVEEAVNEFMKALWEAIAIVLVISFLNLGLRAGLVVATSIPLVLAIVFLVMQIFGIDLQRISLGALIIALGLLVDDAMITIEAMVSKVEHGWDRIKAGIFAYASTAYPRLTGTLVIALGFVPVGFAKSSAGEYTFTLFAVVVIAVLTSWIVAALFTPLIGTMLLKPPKQEGEGKGHHEGGGRVLSVYRRLLLFTMRHAKVTLAVTIAIFGVSLWLARFVPSQFFPASDRPELVLDLRLRHDASIYASDTASQKLDEILRSDPDIVHWSSYVGRGAIRFYLPLDVQLQNDFFSQTIIVTKSLKVRDQVKQRLQAALQEKFPEAVGRVFPLELGPPVGWPVQYRLSGSDPHQVREIADKLAGIVGASPDIQRVVFNWMDPIRKLRIRVNQDEARQLGLSSAAVAQMINAAVSGITCDPGARQHLPHRRGGAGPGRRTHVAGDDPDPEDSAFERTVGAIERAGQGRVRTGFAPDLAPGPAAHPDGPGRAQGWRAGGDRRGGPLGKSLRAEAATAGRLQDRRGRQRRGKREGTGLRPRGLPDRGRADDDGPDVPDAEFQPPVPGLQRRPAGRHRCRPCAVGHAKPDGVRRDAGHRRAGRHDHPKLGHHGGPDRSREGSGTRGLGCRGRSLPGALPSDHPDRAGDDPGHGADRADRLLGPHGLRHHGRARGGHVLTLISLPSLYITWFKIRQDGERTTPTDASTQAPAAVAV